MLCFFTTLAIGYLVNAAVAKGRELGVTENVAVLDDGGNLKAFSRMDGTPIPTIEMAQNKAYTALLGVSTQDFFNFIQGDPSLLAGIPTLERMAAWGGGFPIEVDGEIVGAVGVSGAPTVQNDVDCTRAALAVVSDAESIRRGLRARNIVPFLAKRNTEHGSGLGRWRWVVERTFAWLNQFRRLRARYEKRADIHEAFLSLGCALICWRFLRIDWAAE